MKHQDIKIGADYCVSGRRVRVLAVEKMTEPRAYPYVARDSPQSFWRRPVELWEARDAVWMVQVEEVDPQRPSWDCVGGRDAEGGHWVPTRQIGWTWADEEVRLAREAVAREARVVEADSRRTAWAPLLPRLEAAGLVDKYRVQAGYSGDALAISLTPQQAEALLRGLDATDCREAHWAEVAAEP